MKLPVQIQGLKDVRLPPRPLHLAIGMFDGLHLGHQSVIGSAVHSAQRSGGIAATLTFWPHPSRLIRPENPVPQIMDPETKAKLLHSLGIECVIQQPFDAEFAAIPAEDFVSCLHRALPSLTAIYVGENWRFGQRRQGDVHFLVELGKREGIDVVSSSRIHHNGSPISSTRIRELITDGNIAAANGLLGYTYFSEVQVTGGKRLGRALGFPTLNMSWNPELKPKFGVYAVYVSGSDSDEKLRGVANYGVRPTVESASSDSPPVLEVFLLSGASPFTEGDTLLVEWLHFLRPEMKFEGLDALKDQIARDVQEASRHFG